MGAKDLLFWQGSIDASQVRSLMGSWMSMFDHYFREIYGDRWSRLLSALSKPHQKGVRNCFGGYSSYVMDSASIRAAEALGVIPGESILDMCAAPGGKSLVLLEALQGRGELIANELSSDRRRRLKEVIEKCVPAELQPTIRVTGFDGNRFGLQRKEAFDRVLLDAPCSSERHLLAEDPEMADWKESRTLQLARRQYSLICSALLTLKKGGTLVYSTCSISPSENDGVIERLFERKQASVVLAPTLPDLETWERTRFGYQIFPDQGEGAGPIYLSRLVKI
jgi:16S rRNA C967 or C1407 C5-methylase (RsmB/RsmF family)